MVEGGGVASMGTGRQSKIINANTIILDSFQGPRGFGMTGEVFWALVGSWGDCFLDALLVALLMPDCFVFV